MGVKFVVFGVSSVFCAFRHRPACRLRMKLELQRAPGSELRVHYSHHVAGNALVPTRAGCAASSQVGRKAGMLGKLSQIKKIIIIAPPDKRTVTWRRDQVILLKRYTKLLVVTI